MTTLRDLAVVLRSKNAGPFQVTIDVLFEDDAALDLVERSGVLEPGRVAAAYGLRADEVKGPFFHRAALAAKVTITKRSSAQDPFCTDLMGTAQHIPLAALEVAAPSPSGDQP
jgi:hypothetical protein